MGNELPSLLSLSPVSLFPSRANLAAARPVRLSFSFGILYSRGLRGRAPSMLRRIYALVGYIQVENV